MLDKLKLQIFRKLNSAVDMILDKCYIDFFVMFVSLRTVPR